jgi:hypothetical protein
MEIFLFVNSWFINKYAEDLGRKPEDESIPAEGWK